MHDPTTRSSAAADQIAAIRDHVRARIRSLRVPAAEIPPALAA